MYIHSTFPDYTRGDETVYLFSVKEQNSFEEKVTNVCCKKEDSPQSQFRLSVRYKKTAQQANPFTFTYQKLEKLQCI